MTCVMFTSLGCNSLLFLLFLFVIIFRNHSTVCLSQCLFEIIGVETVFFRITEKWPQAASSSFSSIQHETLLKRLDSLRRFSMAKERTVENCWQQEFKSNCQVRWTYFCLFFLYLEQTLSIIGESSEKPLNVFLFSIFM